MTILHGQMRKGLEIPNLLDMTGRAIGNGGKWLNTYDQLRALSGVSDVFACTIEGGKANPYSMYYYQK